MQAKVDTLVLAPKFISLGHPMFLIFVPLELIVGLVSIMVQPLAMSDVRIFFRGIGISVH